MKLKTVLYLSVFACFSFGLGSCNSCGKTKPDDKPDENKSSNPVSHDCVVDKTTVGNVVTGEMEWAAVLVDDDAANYAMWHEKNRVESIIDAITDEKIMKEEGAKIREKMTEKVATLEKFKLLLYNPNVTAKRLKAGLDSLAADGKKICTDNDTQEYLRCFEDDKYRQKRVKAIQGEANKMKQTIADWDEDINRVDTGNTGGISGIDFLKMVLRKLSDPFYYLKR